MGGGGVSDISAGGGKGVGGMVNGTGLTAGSIARSVACGGGSSVGAETFVDNEFAKVEDFLEDDPLCHLPKPPTSTNSLLTRVSAPTGSRPCNRVNFCQFY